MDVIIVGSGPSAAATALALEGIRDVAITVLDLGGQLESPRVTARSAMPSTSPQRWSRGDVALLSSPPKSMTSGRIPTKQIYGSNFAFANFGQLDLSIRRVPPIALSYRAPTADSRIPGAHR